MFLPTLTFEMPLPKLRIWELATGKLILKEDPKSTNIKLKATSGAIAYQFSNSYLIVKRGCLPPSAAIAPKSWEVETKPITLPQVKGVGGNFYAIKPFAVSVFGVQRSDLGIHYDGTAAGSAGCIVILDRGHWTYFEEKMQQICNRGIPRLALTVIYPILAEIY